MENPHSTVIFRQMEITERDAIGQCGWQSWRALGPLDRGLADPKMAEAIRLGFLRFPFETQGEIFVCYANGQILGWLGQNAKSDIFSDLYIAASEQNQQALRLGLIHAAIAHLAQHQHHEICLTTHQNHFEMISFLKKHGFELIWRGMAQDFVTGVEFPTVKLRRRFG